MSASAHSQEDHTQLSHVQIQHPHPLEPQQHMHMTATEALESLAGAAQHGNTEEALDLRNKISKIMEVLREGGTVANGADGAAMLERVREVKYCAQSGNTYPVCNRQVTDCLLVRIH